MKIQILEIYFHLIMKNIQGKYPPFLTSHGSTLLIAFSVTVANNSGWNPEISALMLFLSG